MSLDQRCASCEVLRRQLADTHQRIDALETEAEILRGQLRETTDLIELQRADIVRYKAEYERIQPNTPERVPKDQLQLAFERVLESLSDVPAARELAAAANEDDESGQPDEQEKKRKTKEKKKKSKHGRRKLDLTNLPVEEIVIDPDQVVESNGEGFELVGEEVSDRVAFKPASYVRLRIVRRKWARTSEQDDGKTESNASCGSLADADASTDATPGPMVTAPLPQSVWPSYMADPSVIAEHIIAKYADSLPLHRQETISKRNGFRVPRSTQCGWLGEAYKNVYRIVDAMLTESIAQAYCIATDATGAPVRAVGECDKWQIFVFIADHDHVVFRYSQQHTSKAMQTMLGGFSGYLLADAAPIYDTLHRDGAIEVGCWFHLRRYYWRALASDPERALEALSLISKLFEIERECAGLPWADHTAERAARAKPILELFDAWIERNRAAADPRGPLQQGIGYYQNQREALHRFVDDGRLRLDNSISEQQLRNVVLGRHNWMFFANETGLKWYTTFRSLIASCVQHDINARVYLEQVLRLAPHWRTSRMLELAPKYWKSTLSKLDPEQLKILIPPWEARWPVVDATASPARAASKLSAMSSRLAR